MLNSLPLQLVILASLVAARTFLAARLSPPQRQKWKSTRETLDSLAITLFVVFFLVQPFIAQAYQIPSPSMENTLPVGTRILASPLAPRVSGVEAGDVLVFSPPPLALQLGGGEVGDVWIKRCIGVPGQTVEMRANVLWRDGKVVPEPYAVWSSPPLPPLTYDLKIVGGQVYSRSYDAWGKAGEWASGGVIASDQAAITAALPESVPPGQLLMLGDHRNDSCDGHLWGLLARDAVRGRAFVAFWPPREMGTISR